MKRNTRKVSFIFLTVLLMTAYGVGVLYSAPKSSEKAITSFSISGVAGNIDEKTITLDLTNMPLFSRVDALVASFTTNGKAVRVGSKSQVSGKTANDFTKPVPYTVTAADGSMESYTVRVLVSKIISVSGYSDTLMVGSDGSLWATGRNGDGQLGNGTTTSLSVPKEILANGIAAVSAGYYHSLILKTDGSLWATGYNKSGQLGNGSTTGVSTPVQVFADGVASASAGVNFSLVVKTDGSLWVTGANASGQLGNGTTTNISTPIQIIESGVASVSGGARPQPHRQDRWQPLGDGCERSRPAWYRHDNGFQGPRSNRRKRRGLGIRGSKPQLVREDGRRRMGNGIQ